jgi:predicted transcriptional regulator
MSSNREWLALRLRGICLEMRGAAAILRYRGIPVTVRSLAREIGEMECTIRKRLNKHTELVEMVGLIPLRRAQ